MVEQRCIRCGQRISWIVLGINLGLFLLKGSFALVSHSRSLLADSFESLASSVITIIVLVSLKIAEKEYDEKYPYGYGKIEFITAGSVNLLLLIGVLFFLFFSVKEMITVGPEKPPDLIAVGAAVVSIVANQIAFKYGRCAGERLQSSAILANAWVNQADVVTSCAVIVGVVGANLGWTISDHIAAILICFLIVKITINGMGKSIKGLMDYSPRVELTKIKDLARGVEGVIEIKDVKTRLVGRKIWVDLEVAIPGNCVLDEGLKIAQKLKRTLIHRVSNIADVAVRLSPAKEDN